MSTDNFFLRLPDNKEVDDKLISECFHYYDKDKDDGLNLSEFGDLAKSLLCDDKGQSYNLSTRMLADMFFVFDLNKDGKIDRDEFSIVWNEWINVLLKPVSAFLVIDVQNDFIDGTLSISNCPAQQRGEEVVPVINSLIENVPFNVVVYSLDWHPDDHVSFIENVRNRKIHQSSLVASDKAKVFDTVIFEGPPKMEQKLWPKHCVQNSWGSQLHPAMKIHNGALFIYKGVNPEIDSYSAFWDNQKLCETNLNQELRNRGITDVYICGLAYDVCVGFTALHALELGYRTVIIHDASRGVDDESISGMQKQLISRNGVITDSNRVKAMVEGKDRRPEMGYRTAMLLASKIL